MDCVLVRWRDPLALNNWYAIDEIPDIMQAGPSRCESVGWLAYEGPDRVVLALTLSGAQIASLLVLPASVVVSITRLEIPNASPDTGQGR